MLFAQLSQNAALQPLAIAKWFNALPSYVTIPVVLLLVFVVPFLLGRLIANALRLKDYSGKIGLVLCTLAASVVTLTLGWPPKLLIRCMIFNTNRSAFRMVCTEAFTSNAISPGFTLSPSFLKMAKVHSGSI